MKRLLPLPERQHDGKKSPRQLEAHSNAVLDAKKSLKEDLLRMKHELEGLQKEELVHSQSQLVQAQDRLKQRRKSDLAKRMQESQRLQLLREKKAELDDTKKSRVVQFKQRMLESAERALERESIKCDILYQNIGEALSAANGDVDDLSDDDNSSVVLGSEMGFQVEGSLRASGLNTNIDKTSNQIGALMDNNPPIDVASLMNPLRVPSAFEAHLSNELKHFTDQLHALRTIHSAPKPSGVYVAGATSAAPMTATLPSSLPLFGSASSSATGGIATFSKQDSIVSPLPLLHGGNVGGSSFASAARAEHLKVRDELRRLIAQGRYSEDEMATTPPLTPHTITAPRTRIAEAREHAKTIDDKVSEKLMAVQAKEASQQARDALVNSSIVPFEDQLVKGRIILENAEANIKCQSALEKAEREKTEKLERHRSVSVFANADESKLTKSGTVKNRKVSMILDEDQSPLTETGSVSGYSTASPPRTLPKEVLPVRLALVTNDEERHRLQMEQQQSRFEARRAVHKEELSVLQKKLRELINEEDLEREQQAKMASFAAAAVMDKETQQQCEFMTPVIAAEHQQELERQQHNEEHTRVIYKNTSVIHDEVVSTGSAVQDVDARDVADVASNEIAACCVVDDGATKEDTSADMATSSATSNAACVIQRGYRCHLARVEVARHRAQHAAEVELRAKWVVEREWTNDHRLSRAQDLEDEASLLRDITRREDLLQEAERLRHLSEREENLENDFVVHAHNKIREAAALEIQRHVRGHQVRNWYHAVQAAVSGLRCDVLSAKAEIIQRWWRGAMMMIKARHVVKNRGKLKRRYDPFLQDAASGGMRSIAAACIQCFARRIMTRYACQRRIKVTREEVQKVKHSEAAAVIQRQWRRYDLLLRDKRAWINELIERASHGAALLAVIGCTVPVARAEAAEITIAKYVRRFLRRDELRSRILQRAMKDAMERVDAMREDEEDSASIASLV